MYIFNLEVVRPRFISKQEDALNWFVEAHAKISQEDRESLKEKLWRVCCKPDRIATRGHVTSDYHHFDWEAMRIYRLHESPTGLPLSQRNRVFQEEVDAIFEQYYPENKKAPDDLIHVTCTGYVAPSGAQKLVSQRGWHTTVTHAYHMGCYGAVPALRIGQGFLRNAQHQVDVVHTEICSLHTNPMDRKSDQLICQSLFSDGFIKYSLGKTCSLPSMKVHAISEEIIPDSRESMTWDVAEWGFQMSLSKEIPVLITRHLPTYLQKWDIPKGALFAVHPGGPKILDYVQNVLDLKEEQLHHSAAILKECGNMSSATLPHIWEKMLQDPNVANGTPIVSLAFGPGLTIASILMEKRCGY